MSNKVSIIYYDAENPICAEKMQKIAKAVEKVTDTKVIVVPDNISIMQNCSVEQLLIIKAQIDSIVQDKIGATSLIPQ